MSDISIDRTLWAGFRVAWRNPRAFGIWLLLYLVCGLGPSILLWGLFSSDFIEILKTSASTTPPADTTAYMSSMMRMNAVSALSYLGAILLYAIAYPAIFRAILQPERRAWGYVRVGLAEVLTGLMFIALYIGLGAVIFVGIIVTMIVVIAAAVAKAVIAAVVLGIVFGLATLGAALWLAVKLSLVLPMIVATGQVEIGKAWALTRGRTGRLFLIGFLLILVVMGMSLVLVGVFGAAALAAIGSIGDLDSIRGFFSRPAQALAHDLTPWGVAIAAFSAVFGTLQLCVMAAPWAEAYRQIVIEPQAPVDVF